MGRFDAANVTRFQLDRFVATVLLQYYFVDCGNDGVKLTIKNSIVGSAPHNVQTFKKPEALAIQLMRGRYPRSAFGFVHLGVDFQVNRSPLFVVDGGAELGQVVLPWESGQSCSGALLGVFANKPSVHVEKNERPCRADIL